MSNSDETYDKIRKMYPDSSSQVCRQKDNEGPESGESEEQDYRFLKLLEKEYIEEMGPEQPEEAEEIFTASTNMAFRRKLAQAERKRKQRAKCRFETEMSRDFEEHSSPHWLELDQEDPEESIPAAPITMETPDRRAIPRPKNFQKLDKMARILSTLTSVPGDQAVLKEQYKKLFMEEQRLLSTSTDVATEEEWDTARGIFNRRKKLTEMSFPGKFENKPFNFPVIMVDDVSGQDRNVPVITIGGGNSMRKIEKLVQIAPRPQEFNMPQDGDDLIVLSSSEAENSEDDVDESPQNVIIDDEEMMILDEQVVIEESIKDVPAEIPSKQEYQNPILNSRRKRKRNHGGKNRKRRLEEEDLPVHVYDEPPATPKNRKRIQFLETQSEYLEQKERRVSSRPIIIEAQKEVIFEESTETIPEQQGYEESDLSTWQQNKRNRGGKNRKRRLEEKDLSVNGYDEPPDSPKNQKRIQFLETHSEYLEQQLLTLHEPEKQTNSQIKIIEAQLFIPKRLQLEEGLRRQKEQKRRLYENQLLSIPYNEATPEQIYKAGLIQMQRKKSNQGNAFQDVYVVSGGACFQVSSTSMASDQ